MWERARAWGRVQVNEVGWIQVSGGSHHESVVRLTVSPIDKVSQAQDSDGEEALWAGGLDWGSTIGGHGFRAAFIASCFRGAFTPTDLRAVCLVRAMAGLG